MARVYIAARGQDQAKARELREALVSYGIGSTARWIDQSLANESHDEAQQDIDDVRMADVLVVLKPKASHLHTTGGHHVETGLAMAYGIPVLLLGEVENVFHRHDTVTVCEFPTNPIQVYLVAKAVYALVMERGKRQLAAAGGAL
jgi:nucleoside 2-deoxyribosyltransferase